MKEKEIISAIKKGADSLAKLKEETGAMSSCGKCKEHCAQLIKQYKKN